MEKIIEQSLVLATDFGMRIVTALIVFLLGRWAAKFLRSTTGRILSQKRLDPTAASFIDNIVYYSLMTFVILMALGRLGIQTASFVAVIGAAGLAVGFALQGSLSNFAAGFLMIIFRPVNVGDYIEGAGTAGIVEKIQIFTTQLKTPDNKTIIVPNSKLAGDNITNYSAKLTRRIDFVFGVSYTDDMKRVKSVIAEVLNDEEKILRDPSYTIGILELADSSVKFAVRPWVKTEDYWDVYFNINERMKERFDAEGIILPFPQSDIHLYQTPIISG